MLFKSVGFIGVRLMESLGKQIIQGLGTPSGHLFLALAFRIFPYRTTLPAVFVENKGKHGE